MIKQMIFLLLLFFLHQISTKISHITTPFWLTQVPKEFTDFSSPNFPIENDITIVGGGISGLSTAFWLTKKNKNQKIVLLEERGLCTGASGRNAGFLTPTVSMNKSEEIRKLEFETYKLIQKISKEFNFKDDFNCFGQSKFSQTEDELKEILQSHNFSSPGIKFWNKEKVDQKTRSTFYNGGRFSKYSCTYSPTKFMKEIFELIKNSINIQTKTKVLNVENFENHIIIHTSKGKIKTKKIIFATNGYTSKLIPELKDFIYPVRGQIIATKPLDSIIWKFVGSTNYGSEYYGQRYSNDGRIILGGFRWKSSTREIGTFDDSVLNSNISIASRKFLKNFKGLENVEIEFEWTGIMGWSKDGLPLIGKLKKNNFIISNFNGHGMPVIFNMAKKLSNFILTGVDKIPKIFNPKRFFFIEKKK